MTTPPLPRRHDVFTRSERHAENVFEVLEVGPNDEYLHRVLRVHGDETVGVVLVRDAGDGVAQVELDYVTPRFRDFSPGEFVWRRSGLLKDDGFRKVVTPEGMVAPHYDRLGFHRESDHFVLDL